MEIFYREKAFHAGKQIRKNDFAPSEKFSCYAPVLMGGSMEPPLGTVREYAPNSANRVLKMHF